MRYIIFTFLLFLYAFTSFAQVKSYINPEGINKPKTYSQAVKVSGGSMIITSGIVADDVNGNIIGKGDLKAQVQRAFENLKIVLSAAGAEMRDVVKMTYYVVNYHAEQLPVIREVRAGFLPVVNPPASTLVGVACLFHPDVLIEIEAIAFLSSKRKK